VTKSARCHICKEDQNDIECDYRDLIFDRPDIARPQPVARSQVPKNRTATTLSRTVCVSPYRILTSILIGCG
jgi:hypothetical protein